MDELDDRGAGAAYREALEKWSCELSLEEWAATQYNLGVALVRQAEREYKTERLKEAVAAFDEALKVWTPERSPENWAATRHHRAAALFDLGMLEEQARKAIALLKETVETLDVLEEHRDAGGYRRRIAACFRRFAAIF